LLESINSDSSLDSSTLLEPTSILLDSIVESLTSKNEIIAWFQGKAEVGPRALGHRSLLANPCFVENIERMNNIKKREKFRPFAPSVLEENVADWFDLPVMPRSKSKQIQGTTKRPVNNISPYMSITLQVKEEKQAKVPAITHVDGSARLQSVSKLQNALYHRLIELFEKKSGVPMILNTSFNILRGEPIVESPYGALRSFLASREQDSIVFGDSKTNWNQKGIDRLILGPFSIRKKPFPKEIRRLKEKTFTSYTPTNEKEKVDIDTSLIARVPYILDEVITKGDASEEVQSIRILLPEGEGLVSENQGTWIDLQNNLIPNLAPILFQIFTALPEREQAIVPIREMIDSLVEELELNEIVQNSGNENDGVGSSITNGQDLLIEALNILYDKRLILFIN